MIFVWIMAGAVGFMAVAFVFLCLRTVRASQRRNQQLEAMIQPAIDAVLVNDPNAANTVLVIANLPATRNALFNKLDELGRAEAFPEHFRTPEMFAESDMVQWLMHPNELGAMPEEIQLVRVFKVQEESRLGSGYLFRFRAHPTHWAANKGWMAGIAGPVWDGEELPPNGRATFSELTPFDSMTEDQHIEMIKKCSTQIGLVIPVARES